MILQIKKLNQALGDFLFLFFYCYLLNQALFLLDFELQGLIYVLNSWELIKTLALCLVLLTKFNLLPRDFVCLNHNVSKKPIQR